MAWAGQKDNSYIYIYILTTSLFVSLSLIAFLILSSSTTTAVGSSATASVTVAAACTMSSVINTAHNTTISNGTYKEDIGKTTLKVVCNDNSGFSVYAVGYSGDKYGNNKLLANVGGVLSPTNDIVTGTATSGNTSNWAMKVSAVSGTYAPTIQSDTNGTFSNYHIVPDKYAKVATFTSTTDAVVGSSIEATYRAYVSGTQPAGSYTGKVKYTMVNPASAIPNQPMDCDPNRICYWPNAEGSVVDSMGDQAQNYDGINTNNITSNMEVQLWASNFRRDGYGFAGWSDKYDWVLNENDENGNGTGPNAGYHIYGPNATITTPSDMATKGLSLYAVWIPAQGTLQNWNGCSVMNIGEVTALKDARDHNAYAVAKLKDGKCWMVENLRLDNTNSDNSTGALAQGYGTSTTYGNFSGLAEPETAHFDYNNTTANSIYYSGTQSGTASIDIGTSNYPYYRFPRYNNQDTASPVTNMTAYNSNVYSVGNWYTWSAAVADTSYYSTNNQSVTGTSICPKGWRLPKGGSSANASYSDFWKLGLGIMGFAPSNNSIYQNTETNTDGKNATQAYRGYPNNFIYSGAFLNSWVTSRGDKGFYWSSTVRSYYVPYYLVLDSPGVYPGTFCNDFKSYGLSIRCMQ